jgi:predicted glycosyltransferase
VRDILQESRKPGRAEETVRVVREFFDMVFVHGDSAFARLEDTFPAASAIADRLIYTGLVAGENMAPAEAAGRFDVVVSAGGGVVGRKLIAATAEAARTLSGEWPHWCIITGPQFPIADRKSLATGLPPGVRLETFRPDFASLLGAARLSVSQAGYNTVCDILRARCRAVLIPFAEGGETEQMARARRLEELGFAAVIAEEHLTPQALATAMRNAPEPPFRPIDLGGAEETARVLRARLDSGRRP